MKSAKDMNKETDSNLMDLANDAIKKGEKTRILFEILLSELGCTLDNSLEEIYNKLKITQDEYNEAIKMMSIIVQEARKKDTQKNGVSVSNY